RRSLGNFSNKISPYDAAATSHHLTRQPVGHKAGAASVATYCLFEKFPKGIYTPPRQCARAQASRRPTTGLSRPRDV
ncbi:MAG: hypothetical protein ACK4SY_09800, partial [Pyrobaculum sp.]